MGVLRQLRATDSMEGMSAEYLSMLTPEDDPRVTVELVEKLGGLNQEASQALQFKLVHDAERT